MPPPNPLLHSPDNCRQNLVIQLNFFKSDWKQKGVKIVKEIKNRHISCFITYCSFKNISFSPDNWSQVHRGVGSQEVRPKAQVLLFLYGFTD